MFQFKGCQALQVNVVDKVQDVLLVNTFSQSEGCLFILFMLPFAVQILFILM